MSGVKYSEIQLQRERQEKLDAIRRLESLNAEMQAVSAQVTERVEKLSPGLRETFAAEVRAAQQWGGRNDKMPVYNTESRLEEISRTVTTWESACKKGQSALENLHLATTRKADELGRELSRQLAAVNRQLLESERVLELWCGETAVAAWRQAVSQAEELQRNEQYHKVRDLLQKTQNELKQKCPWAAAQEEKHQRRIYLLKALRQVSADLGFNEQEAPRFETQGDRGSRILFTADTRDRGMINFYLTLDGLSSYSEMGDDRCPVEFGELSQQLETEFGIHTQFRPQDGSAKPKLRRKGEKDLPEDGARTAEGGRN
ncbi:MAG: hypothetical protein GY862_07995 [Gammaproteobacteria bacterium]|nr:hypothetical protein [Gammaproteobacteria bacterium]